MSSQFLLGLEGDGEEMDEEPLEGFPIHRAVAAQLAFKQTDGALPQNRAFSSRIAFLLCRKNKMFHFLPPCGAAENDVQTLQAPMVFVYYRGAPMAHEVLFPIDAAFLWTEFVNVSIFPRIDENCRLRNLPRVNYNIVRTILYHPESSGYKESL